MTKQKYLDLDLTSKISNHCLIGNLSAICNRILLGPKLLACAACLWSKMPMFQRAGMREGGLPLLLAFQYLIPMIWRACDLKWKTGIPTLRTCHFEASEDIMTEFKSQAFHTRRIKQLKVSGSGNPPSLIPALRNISIYVLKMKFSILFCTRLYVFFIQQSRLNSLQPLRSSQWANSGLGIKTPSIWLALPRLFQMQQLPGGIEIAKSTEKLLIEITRFLDMDPDLISL